MDGVILGGDRRSACLAELLTERWADIHHFLYTDSYDYNRETLHRARFIVLPAFCLGGIVAGKYHQISVCDVIADMADDSLLFCGRADDGMKIAARQKGIRIFSFLEDEPYVFVNAQLTAEGALMRCIELSDQSLFQAKCVITGSGRIARALYPLVHAFTPFIEICARNHEIIERLKWQGIHAMELSDAPCAFEGANWIFNTIPNPCLQPSWFMGTAKDCGYMELASAPYGIRREQVPVHVVYRLESGLPGRISPMSAAQVMLSSIERNWEEYPWKL